MQPIEVFNMTPEQFANHLYHVEKMDVQTIRRATGLFNFNPTTPVAKPVKAALAPNFGDAFENTPLPITVFEEEIKDAGHYKTVADAAQSVIKLQNLLDRATGEGDSKAVFAVLNRALVIGCRALSKGKSAQGRIFADWLKRTL